MGGGRDHSRLPADARERLASSSRNRRCPFGISLEGARPWPLGALPEQTLQSLVRTDHGCATYSAAAKNVSSDDSPVISVL
ncbi:hypothetical protein DL765_006874 [Monosporascus sp. GIB2]|nr:hypothetical protein DL765_006874 [Monosporascus sp. GIB2]